MHFKNPYLTSIFKQLFTLCIFLAIFYFSFQNKIHNYLGEKLFLNLHYHQAAIFILERNSKPDFLTHHLLGRLYFVESNLNSAIKNFTSAIERNPVDVKSYYGRGLSYGFSEPQIFLTHAENDFLKVLKIYENYPEIKKENEYGMWAVYNDLAWIYFLKGDFKKMESTARDGLKISMSNAWLANMLGVSLLAQGKCHEAKIYFQSAKNLLENKSSLKFGEAYSGDNSQFWKVGLENMKNVIGNNLKLCEK